MKMKIFTKIDLKKAYKKNTYRQLFQRSDDDMLISLLMWTRIKIASVSFQRTREQVIEDDIENIVCYQDDICIETRNVTLYPHPTGPTHSTRPAVGPAWSSITG